MLLGKLIITISMSMRARCWGGEPCDVPDKAGELAGNRHQRDAVRLAARGELAKAFAQPQLCVPGPIDDGSGYPFVALAQTEAVFAGHQSQPGHADRS